jgi:2-hydroxychromene-2-carboxylate isomerase
VAPDEVVFYYDVSSPYAYLAAARIGETLPEAVWRPISFGVVVRRIDKLPWSMRPGRETGMADVAERAAERGLPDVRWPEGWPAETYSLAPLRAAVAAERSGLLEPFTLECYRLAFAEGRSLAELDNVLLAAERAGLDRDAVRAAIEDPAVKDRLREYTEEAIARGVTGVPTVAVGDRLFWGDDRLEEAAAAAATS